MTRMYHAVAAEYEAGEDIYSYGELEQMDLTPAWKWEDDPVDTDCVSVTADINDAIRIAEMCGLSRVLVIDWDAVSEECVTGTNGEGYPIAYGRIPAVAVIDTIAVPA